MKIAHLGFVVPEIDNVCETWIESGYVLSIKKTLDPIQNVDCALLTKPGEPNIELISPNSAGPNPLFSRLKRGGGLDHICYYSLDLEKSIQSELDIFSIVVCPPVYAATFDSRVTFVMRRNGLLIEYLEYKETDQ